MYDVAINGKHFSAADPGVSEVPANAALAYEGIRRPQLDGVIAGITRRADGTLMRKHVRRDKAAKGDVFLVTEAK